MKTLAFILSTWLATSTIAHATTSSQFHCFIFEYTLSDSVGYACFAGSDAQVTPHHLNSLYLITWGRDSNIVNGTKAEYSMASSEHQPKCPGCSVYNLRSKSGKQTLTFDKAPLKSARLKFSSQAGNDPTYELEVQTIKNETAQLRLHAENNPRFIQLLRELF